jgi:pimeloyl-ACP methyl ester carboxylesterase
MSTGQFIHDGIRFAFDAIGTGDTQLLLHGLGGDRQGALELAAPAKGWRAVSPDQRGHGESEPVGPDTGFTFEVLASDAIACLDAHDVARAVLIGVSMGAGVALRVAVAHPERVRALALVRPAWIHEPMTENLTPYVEVAALLRSLPVADAALTFQASPTYARVAAVSSHGAESLLSQFRRPKALERSARLDLMPRSTPYASHSELRSIDQPTLVIGCDRDPLHPFEFAREWSGLIPNARLLSVTSSADDIGQHRQEVRVAVAGFLTSLDPRASHP